MGGSSSDLPSVTRYYHYDGLKRLTDASHYPGAASTPSLTDTERGIVYDLNGNITALKRYASSGSGGDLTFTHTGNRMTSVTNANATGNDAGPKAFTYDANGNMTSDGRKGLELTWNVLNLVDSAAMHGSSLKYAWLSDGTKVSAKADDGNGNGVQKRYLGSFVLTSNTEHSADEATEVESIAWDEGRIFFDVPVAVDDPIDPFTFPGELEPVMDSVIVDSTSVFFGYRDCWFAGDHLGNVRSVIDITPDLIAPLVLEQSNYLPYGTRIQDQYFTSAMADNRWRYAGKEAQRYGPAGAFSPMHGLGSSTLDLGLLNFGARMYDPFTARWTAVDPMAACNYESSPHMYCMGSPISFFDPNGTNWYQSQENGGYFWFDGNKERKGYDNLGENLSIQGRDGYYYNFYHNQYLGVSDKLISDLTSVVLNNNSLLGMCLGKGSSLSEQDKSNLLARSVASAGESFLTDHTTIYTVTVLSAIASGAELVGAAYGTIIDFLSTGHVFWSGGLESAGALAADFASSTGMKTLEMTWAGKVLTNLTNRFGYSKTEWLWKIASRNFARETHGTAHVFLGEKVRKRAIWHEEKEILEKNGVNIITHQ